MKSIYSLRENNITNKLDISTCSHRIDFLKKRDIDWDVYLESKGVNLQRGFVWDVNQKRELIWSLFIGRKIPSLSIISAINGSKEDRLILIDGKQRLNAIFSFMDNEFSIEIDGYNYHYSDLPDDYQIAVSKAYIQCDLVYESHKTKISDLDKIRWFKLINFSGTEMDRSHIEMLNNLI